MYRRISLVLLAQLCLVPLAWSQSPGGNPPSGKPDSGTNTSSSVEVQGVGVVRVPADGVRIFATLHLRMPTAKEVVAEEERRAAKLEKAWRDLNLGNLKIRLLDQQLQAVRQLDPNQPNLDITELPVVGYAAWRLYCVEIAGLPTEQLVEAARHMQRVALEQGATVGLFARPSPLGTPTIEGQALGEMQSLAPVQFFLADSEAAYREALKRAKQNALAKIHALCGDRAPSRTLIQEIQPEQARLVYGPLDAVIPIPRPVNQFVTSTSTQIEIVAFLKVVCEY